MSDTPAHGSQETGDAAGPVGRIRKAGRRVRTEPREGYLGEPPAERSAESDGDKSGENDARLLGDKPPHWG